MARLPLLAEKERKTDAGRRGGRKGAVPMNERFYDGFEFGPDERDAPTWSQIWDASRGCVYGGIAGTAIGLAICLVLAALGII